LANKIAAEKQAVLDLQAEI